MIGKINTLEEKGTRHRGPTLIGTPKSTSNW